MAHRVQRRRTDGRQQRRCPATTKKERNEHIYENTLLNNGGIGSDSRTHARSKGYGSGSSSNYYNFDHSWSNDVNHNFKYENLWGTNCLPQTEAPKAWSNQLSHAYAGQAQAGGGDQVRSRFGKTEVPADVQTIVKQFTQDRTRLMSQLKTCSDEERKLILKEMEQLRTQLRSQIAVMRDDARQQAEQMRNRFRNNRDRILDEGAGSAGGGRDR